MDGLMLLTQREQPPLATFVRKIILFGSTQTALKAGHSPLALSRTACLSG